MVLWDLAGKDAEQDIPQSYLRGSHGVLYVVDGTRRETLEQLPELEKLVREAAGAVPSLVALNKADLTGEWRLSAADEAGLKARGLEVLRTSAKTGDAVEDAFGWLARATLQQGGEP
jgi:GTPase SAR1 family protein